MMFIVTVTLGSIPYQIVGSNRSLALPVDPAVRPERAYPSITPAPAMAIRKPRREGSGEPLSPWADKLTMIGYSSHSRSCKLDGFAYSRVGHAAADVPGHYGVYVAVTGGGIIFEQRGCLHDLSRLTVPALRNLKLKPCRLQRMLALRIEPFDRRDLRPSDGAKRGDARSRRASFHVHRAGAAKTDPAAEFGAGETDLVADYPQQRRVIRTVDRDAASVEFEGGHNRLAPSLSISVIVISSKHGG